MAVSVSACSFACSFLFAAVVSAQGVTPSAGKSTGVGQIMPVDPAVTLGVLPNGLRYYLRVNKKPADRAELRLVVDAGSVLEEADQRGLAHFMEHMEFDGTAHFAKNKLIEYLQSVGMSFGGDLNASTSYDETIYKLTVPTDTARVIENGLQILDDWAHAATLDTAEIVRERGVVLEEWRLHRGADARMQERHDSLLYQGSRYATRLPIGLETRIKTAQRPEIARFYHDWYRPDLMAVVVVGDFDPAKMETMIRKQFADIPATSAVLKKARPRVPTLIPGNVNPIVSVVADPEATGTTVQLILKYPRDNPGTVASLRRSLVENMYYSLLNARLSEIAQRTDPPFLGAQSGSGTLGRAVSVYSLAASVKDDGIPTGLAAMLTEVERVAQYGFTATELDRQKKSVLRGVESAYTARADITSAAYVNSYINHFLTGSPIASMEQQVAIVQQLLPGITAQEVNQLANVWIAKQGGGGKRVKDLIVLVSLPQKAGVVVPTQTELLAVFDSTLGSVAAQRKELTRYQEAVSSTPLMQHLPTSGRVVSERVIKDASGAMPGADTGAASVGVIEWKLSNGVRVLLKPTDFEKDQIAVTGYGRGGTSLAPASDFVSAQMTMNVLSIGGLGEYDRVELQKKLAGKIVSVGASIDSYSEEIAGSGSPADAETLMQLLYMQFTSPRVDTAAIAAFKAAARTNLANRAASPTAAFQDSAQAVLAQHNPLARQMTVAMVDSIDVDRSLAFYRDRFADASGFTFVIVGAFNTDSLKPLVERYLGGLPSSGRTQEARDLGIRPPNGVVRKMVYAGTEPKSITEFYFHGPATIEPETGYVLGSLADVVRLRLTQTLREQLGGTYGVEVGASYTRTPYEHYELTIAFGSAPDRVDELTKAVFDVIRSLKADGPTPAEMREVTETQRRGRETSLKQNQFWLSTISTYDKNGWDMEHLFSPGVISLNESIKGLTAGKIKTAAQQYFNMDNYIQFSLFPKSTVEAATGSLK